MTDDDGPADEPKAPEGVRLIDADGVEYPATVAFAGYGPGGIARWFVMPHGPGVWRAVRVDTFPGQCELVVPFGEEG